MKDSEFIELLNLYLDHEISAADAARLEAEVQNNPARRRVYEDYCRMQKACKMLVADFQSEPARDTAKNIVAFDEVAAGRRRTRIAFAGAAAAAACVALLFVASNRPSTEAGPVAAREPALTENVVAVASTTDAADRATVPTSGLVRRPMLAEGMLSLTARTQVERVLVGADSNEQLAWLHGLQLAPLPQRMPVEELRFEMRPASLRPDVRTIGINPAANETAAEMAAFRFLK